MRIDKSQVKISFDFTPREYFLCKSDDTMLGDYTLNYRIDRSEKGKDDDIGMPRIYLSEQEAQICRENGFSEII
jgi:hypothetical protein